MNDDEAFAALMNFLEVSGVATDDREQGVVSVLHYDESELQPPLHLHLTPAVLGRRLRCTAVDASSVFPDVEPVHAAWRLFTVHLDEAIRTAGVGRTELVLDRYGVRPVSPDELAGAPTKDEQKRFDELVDHVAGRGDVVADHWRGPITILEYRGVRFAPPLRFEVSPRSLSDHLRASGDDWSSFLTEVDEGLGAVGSGGAGLVLGDGGIMTGSPTR